MSKKQRIRLTTSQRRKLRSVVQKGTHKAREILAAHVLLKSSQGWSDAHIAETFETSLKTVQRIRQRYSAGGLTAALHEQPRSGQPRKLTVSEETALIALVCSKPPAGRCRWTVRLLTQEAHQRGLVPTLSPETVRQVLKKIKSNRGKSRVGVRATSPPTSSSG